MEKVASFEEFRKKIMTIEEDDSTMIAEIPVGQDAPAESSGKEEHYMFFRNLMTIKHHIEEILSMDPAKVDAMIGDGHDWAEDHISAAKEDIQQVADWVRGEIDMEKTDKAELVVEPSEPEVEMVDDEDEEESDDDSEESVD